MAAQSVTVDIPAELYERLKQRADQARRTVEEELLEVLATAVPADEELPTDLADAVAALPLLDDAALWRAARSAISSEVATDLETLHMKRQREGLTETEARVLSALVRQYERTMLVRAQAAALLKQRGHDVNDLVLGR